MFTRGWCVVVAHTPQLPGQARVVIMVASVLFGCLVARVSCLVVRVVVDCADVLVYRWVSIIVLIVAIIVTIGFIS